MSGPLVDRDQRASARIRRGIELIEQAPAEALYKKLLETLTRAGADADQGRADGVSRKIVFAYKLAVELGGKLNLLAEEDLAVRRRLAALLFGEDEPPICDGEFDSDEGDVRTIRGPGAGR